MYKRGTPRCIQHESTSHDKYTCIFASLDPCSFAKCTCSVCDHDHGCHACCEGHISYLSYVLLSAFISNVSNPSHGTTRKPRRRCSKQGGARGSWFGGEGRLQSLGQPICFPHHRWLTGGKLLQIRLPIGSMYVMFTYIWLIFMVKVGKYTSPMDPMDYVTI